MEKSNENNNARGGMMVESVEIKKLKENIKDLNERLIGVKSSKEFEEVQHKQEMDNIQKKLYQITKERDIAAQLIHYYSSPAPGQIPCVLGSAGVLSSPLVSVANNEVQ